MSTNASSQYNSYAIPNSVLIEDLKLIKHPEGGLCYACASSRLRGELTEPILFVNRLFC